MTEVTYAKQWRLVFILATVAAVLALSAAAIAWIKDGRVEVTPLGGGLFMAAMAISAWQKRKP